MAKSADRDINRRIKDICDTLFNGNVTQLAKASYISRTTLISIIGDQQSAPGYDVLRKLVEIPTVDISEAWLLTGNGEMLKSQTVEPGVNQTNSNNQTNSHNQTNSNNSRVNDSQVIIKLLAQLEEKDKQIATRDSQISALIQMLGK